MDNPNSNGYSYAPVVYSYWINSHIDGSEHRITLQGFPESARRSKSEIVWRETVSYENRCEVISKH